MYSGGNYGGYPSSSYDNRGAWTGDDRGRSMMRPGGKKKRSKSVGLPSRTRWEIATVNRPVYYDDSSINRGGVFPQQQQQQLPQQQPMMVPQQQQQRVFLGPVPPLPTSNLSQQGQFGGQSTPISMMPSLGNTYYGYIQQPQTGNPIFDLVIGSMSGKVPSNELVHEAGDMTREVLEEQRYNPNLHPAAQTTARHLEAVIESFQRLLQEKNGDEKWQKFLIDANLAATSLAQKAKQQSLDRQQLAQTKMQAKDLNETAKGTLALFVNVLKTLVRSHTFRSLILDAIKLFEDIGTQEANKQQAGQQQQQYGFQQSGSSFGQGPSYGSYQQQPMGGYSTIYGQPSSSFAPSQQFYGSSPVYGQTQFSQQPMNAGYPTGFGYGAGFQEDKKQELAARLRTLLEKLSENQDFIDAMRGLFLLIDNVSNIQSNKVTAFNPAQDPQMNVLWMDAKSILYEFVGQKVLDDFLNHVWYLIQSVRNDQQSIQLFHELRAFIMQSLENPTLIRDRNHIRQSEDLINRIRLWSQRSEYRRQLDDIYRDTRLMGEMLRSDRSSIRLMKDLRALGQDIFLDSSTGKFSAVGTRQSLFQMKDLLLPLLVRYLEVIHIPRISGESNAYQFFIEDLIIQGKDILPDHVVFRTASDGDFHIQKSKKGHCKTFITMEIKKFALRAHRFKFFYRKLTGFPKLEDQGIADFNVTGRKNRLVLVWKIKSKDGILNFSMKNVECYIDKVKIRVLESRHSFLNKLGIGLAAGTIKKKIRQAIIDGVYGITNSFNMKLNQALLPSDRRTYRRQKREKGAFGIPESLSVGTSETYVHTDPYTTRFGKASMNYY